MPKFDESKIVLYKELAKRNIADFSPTLEKLKKSCLKIAVEIEEIEKKMLEAKDIQVMSKFSKISEEKRDELLKILPLKKRIERIIEKNLEREKYCADILKTAGIYNDKADSKQVDEAEKQELKNISEQALGINQYNVEYKFFDRELLCFVGGKFDWSNETNKSVLLASDEKLLHEIVERFPESVKSIEPSLLLNTSFKRKLLKQLTSYVYDRLNHQSIIEINNSLSGLLRFKTQITETLDSYIAGVQNLFNVMIKDYLLDTYPEKADEIDQKLKCNEDSGLLPFDLLQKFKNRKTQKSQMSDEKIVSAETEDDSSSDKSDDSILDIIDLLSDK